MRKWWFFLLLFSILSIVLANISTTFNYYNKKYSSNLDNKLLNILGSDKIWPDQTTEYLSFWENMHRQTTYDLNEIVQKINKQYFDSYIKLLFHYMDNPYSCNKDCDGRKVPNFEVDKIYKEVCESNDIQIYTAYILKSLFIESRISKIKNINSELIDNNSFIVLWSLKYFNAIMYYESVREWVNELWEIVGFALDINYYTFGAYVPYDPITYEEIWTQGPAEEDLTQYPPDVKTNINPVLKKYIDDLYDYVFIKKGNV